MKHKELKQKTNLSVRTEDSVAVRHEKKHLKTRTMSKYEKFTDEKEGANEAGLQGASKQQQQQYGSTEAPADVEAAGSPQEGKR